MTYTFKLSRRLAANDWSWARRTAVGLAATLTTACGASGGPTDPSPTPTPAPAQAGWLTLEFTTPRADDGAVQIALTGPSLDTLRAADSFQGIGVKTGSTTAALVVTGTLRTGAVARVWVPDVAKANQYTATVQAVAARGTYAVRETAGYSVVVVR